MNETACTRTAVIGEGVEVYDFRLVDAKGRKVGCSVSYRTEVYEAGGERPFTTTEPGTYLIADPQATRAGKPFGPITSAGCRIRVEEGKEIEASNARAAYIARYLKGAQARALKSFRR